MKWLDLISNDPTQGQQIVARCALSSDDGPVQIQGEPWITQELKRGFRGSKNGVPAIILPEDGLLFLQALGQNYSGHMIVATQIQTGEMPEFNTNEQLPNAA